jgi:NADH dehydrogenase (ubiquinone) 1 alpha subcomplex subunit 8
MSTYHDGSTSSQPYKEPSPLPNSIPKVDELGTTSAPLKSAAFFIGAYCKDYNGSSLRVWCERGVCWN